VLAPLASGYAADHIGLQAPLWGLLGFALVGCLAALGLRETAPLVSTAVSAEPVTQDG